MNLLIREFIPVWVLCVWVFSAKGLRAKEWAPDEKKNGRGVR
jgi:hypothetical protein